MLITISGLPGSGKTTVARLVAAELGGGAVSVGAAVRGVLSRSLSIAVLAVALFSRFARP